VQSAKASVQPTVAAIRSALGDLSNNTRKVAGSKGGKDKIITGGIEKPAATVTVTGHVRRASASVAPAPQRQPLGPRHSVSTRPPVRPGRSLSAVIAGATRTISGAPAKPLPARARTVVVAPQQVQQPVAEDGMEISDNEDGGDTEPEDNLVDMDEVQTTEAEDTAVETLVDPSPEPEVDDDDWTMASPATHARYAAQLEQVKSTFKDEIDEWDMTMVSEYSDEIFAYMGKLEVNLYHARSAATRLTAWIV
jgi:hypothetical protein